MRNRSFAATLLAAVWVAIAVFALERFLPSATWRGPHLLGVSLSYLLIRVATWGVLPALLLPRTPLWSVGFFLVGLDLVLLDVMTMSTIGGELAGLALAFVPAQLFYRWSRDQTHLRGRVALHFIYYTALLLWVLPAVLLELTTGSFELLSTPLTRLDNVVLQTIALPGILGIAATLEFRDRGRGTPMPHDPPLAMVTTGPYAYVANPFQIAKVLLLLGWGVFLQSGWVVAASSAVFVYGVTFARWNENRDLSERFGSAWIDYRDNVRPWLLRWRAWRSPAHPRAILYFDGDCNQCRQLARWFATASHLELVPAGQPLTRLTYDPRDGGPKEEGIAGLARALEHVHLGWAFIGWSLRVPFLQPLFQLIADAVTGAPEPPNARECRLAVGPTAVVPSSRSR